MNTILDLIPVDNDTRFKPKPPGVSYFLGLDLGQRQDHSAIALIERAVLATGEFDRVTYQRLTTTERRLREVRRIPLDTPYTRIASHVADSVDRHPYAGQTTLAVDATGVGRPVVDHLKSLRPPCKIVPVVITGQGQPHNSNGALHVPRQDLIANLQILLENKAITASGRASQAHLLKSELLNFGNRSQHDDLVFAAALAAWLAR